MADLKDFLGTLGDDGAQSFLNTIESLGVSLDDKRIEDFLKEIDLIDALHDRQREDLEAALEAALNREPVTIDYGKLAAILNTQVRSISNAPSATHLLLACLAGISTGVVGAGLSMYVYFVPAAISASHLQATIDLKYLQSDEGKLFRSIVRLNSGYLDPSRCPQDAAKRGYYLSRGKEKLTNVCLLLMPDRL
ncbi:MAG: hypothetical protein HC778_00115 [Chamaesiphon sp. CSU_1_12]|nr:hypothetical protein [Chamaesiphon sp. CSU_1_12]